MDSYNPAKKQRSSQQKLILATVAVLGLSLAFWVFSWFRGSEVTSPAFVTKVRTGMWLEFWNLKKTFTGCCYSCGRIQRQWDRNL